MGIKLRATSKEFEFEDAGGYRFTVTAYLEPGQGWSASVSMRADGLRECDDAVKHLAHAARAFLRMLDNDKIEETP